MSIMPPCSMTSRPSEDAFEPMMLALALATTLIQQTLSYMAMIVVPVAAPELAKVMDADIGWVGYYSAILFSIASLFMLFSGGLIRRYGATRMSQIALIGAGIGLAMGITGDIWAVALGAVMIGVTSAFSTPSSSDILARFAPPKHAALVFSIKQTGVPLGGILAGLLVPFLLINFGWQGIFYGTSSVCLFLAALLQVTRHLFDTNRDPDHSIRVTQAYLTLKGIVTRAPFRRLGYTVFAYCGLQGAFSTFFVAFLVAELGYSLVAAGAIFAISQIASVFARILWGWVVGLVGSVRPVLSALGLSMAGIAATISLMVPGWSETLVTLVAIAYSATALSWHGVVLAAIANRSKPEEVAINTGGVLAFAAGGQFVYPAVIGGILGAGMSFGFGFALAALPALAVGIMFLVREINQRCQAKT